MYHLFIVFIYCLALAMKTLPSGLQKMLQDVVKIVNYISVNASTSRLLEVFCEEVGSDYKVLLLHTRVIFFKSEFPQLNSARRWSMVA